MQLSGFPKQLYWWLAIISFVLVITSGGIAASAALSEGYQSDQQYPAGTIVSLDRDSARKVKPSSRETVEDLVGVIIVPEEALLSLSSGSNEVQVASSGVAAALVSTLGGDIKSGDRITASQIEGVGMKANSATKVVGVAQADFNTSSQGTIKREVKTADGTSQSVVIGKIPLVIDVGTFSAGDSARSNIPSLVREIADAVAGKQVSAARIILSALLLLSVIMVDAVFIYGSVRGSIISIGRNPLSSNSIRKSLMQVIVVAMAVLLVTFGGVYLILTR